MCKPECYFCGTKCETVEAAIDLNWLPSFYDGEDEVAEPVCKACTADHLHRDNDGEFVRNTIGTELVRLSPDAREHIRKAYYAIADNLKPLADSLEMADLERGGKGGPLINEHLIVCEMLAAFEKLTVGRFL